jgi:vacuolar protein sorting-associated protein 29
MVTSNCIILFDAINISTITEDVTPSFILLAIQGLKVVTYVYELHGDQVDVSKSEFSKAA